MSNYIDPTKKGTKGLKGINRLGYDPNTLGLIQSYQNLNNHLKKDISHYDDGTLYYNPLPVDAGDWGNSVYDDNVIVGNITADRLANMRADAQGAGVQLLNGILKGVTTAVTTIADGVFGLPFGLVQAAIEKDLSKIWDNPVTQATKTISDTSEKLLPNYRDTNEQEGPFWEHLASANFWGDTIIKNTGFVVGALYGGIPGAALGGLTGRIPAAIAKTFKASQKALKNAENLGELTAKSSHAVYSAALEGSVEAKNNSADWYNLQKAKVDDYYSQALNSLKNYYIEGTPEYQLAQNQILKAYNNSLVHIDNKRKEMGNMNLVLNIPLLTMSNCLQFAKILGGGFSTGTKLFNIEGTLGNWKALTKEHSYLKKGIKNSLAEGAEEMTLKMVSDFSGNLKEAEAINAVIDEFRNAKADIDASKSQASIISSLGNAIFDNLGNHKSWEEFFVGALFGLVGMPDFGKKENGKWGYKGMAGGIWDEYKKTLKQIKEENEIVDYLNTRGAKELKETWESLVRNKFYETEKQKAIKNKDEKAYHDANLKLAISDVIMFGKIGKLELLEALLDDMVESANSDEFINELIEGTKRTVTVEEKIALADLKIVDLKKSLLEQLTLIKFLTKLLDKLNELYTKELEKPWRNSTLLIRKDKLAEIDEQRGLIEKQLDEMYKLLETSSLSVQELINAIEAEKQNYTEDVIGPFLKGNANMSKEEVLTKVKDKVNQVKSLIETYKLVSENLQKEFSGTLSADLLETLTFLRLNTEANKSRILDIFKEFNSEKEELILNFNLIKESALKDLEEAKNSNKSEEEIKNLEKKVSGLLNFINNLPEFFSVKKEDPDELFSIMSLFKIPDKLVAIYKNYEDRGVYSDVYKDYYLKAVDLKTLFDEIKEYTDTYEKYKEKPLIITDKINLNKKSLQANKDSSIDADLKEAIYNAPDTVSALEAAEVYFDSKAKDNDGDIVSAPKLQNMDKIEEGVGHAPSPEDVSSLEDGKIPIDTTNEGSDFVTTPTPSSKDTGDIGETSSPVDIKDLDAETKIQKKIVLDTTALIPIVKALEERLKEEISSFSNKVSDLDTFSKYIKKLFYLYVGYKGNLSNITDKKEGDENEDLKVYNSIMNTLLEVIPLEEVDNFNEKILNPLQSTKAYFEAKEAAENNASKEQAKANALQLLNNNVLNRGKNKGNPKGDSKGSSNKGDSKGSSGKVSVKPTSLKDKMSEDKRKARTAPLLEDTAEEDMHKFEDVETSKLDKKSSPSKDTYGGMRSWVSEFYYKSLEDLPFLEFLMVDIRRFLEEKYNKSTRSSGEISYPYILSGVNPDKHKDYLDRVGISSGENLKKEKLLLKIEEIFNKYKDPKDLQKAYEEIEELLKNQAAYKHIEFLQGLMKEGNGFENAKHVKKGDKIIIKLYTGDAKEAYGKVPLIFKVNQDGTQLLIGIGLTEFQSNCLNSDFGLEGYKKAFFVLDKFESKDIVIHGSITEIMGGNISITPKRRLDGLTSSNYNLVSDIFKDSIPLLGVVQDGKIKTSIAESKRFAVYDNKNGRRYVFVKSASGSYIPALVIGSNLYEALENNAFVAKLAEIIGLEKDFRKFTTEDFKTLVKELRDIIYIPGLLFSINKDLNRKLLVISAVNNTSDSKQESERISSVKLSLDANGNINEKDLVSAFKKLLESTGYKDSLTVNLNINKLNPKDHSEYIKFISLFLHTNLDRPDTINDWFTYRASGIADLSTTNSTNTIVEALSLNKQPSSDDAIPTNEDTQDSETNQDSKNILKENNKTPSDFNVSTTDPLNPVSLDATEKELAKLDGKGGTGEEGSGEGTGEVTEVTEGTGGENLNPDDIFNSLFTRGKVVDFKNNPKLQILNKHEKDAFIYCS